MAELTGIKVAILVTDGFEESELTSPLEALKDAGAQVDIIAPHDGKIQGFKHFDKSKTVRVDKTLDEVTADQYDAVHLPGGALNADALRAEAKALDFLRAMDQTGKPISAICHAPWTLVSAGLLKGRKITSYHTIQDDIRNAGGEWQDQEVLEDENWVTSRKPDDLPAFNKAMVGLFRRLKQPLAA